MNSEKVKEIKKALEVYGNENKGITILRSGEIQSISYADILTYINELEKCSEKWQKLCADEVALNKTFKDKINELESENESCYEVLADLKTIIKQQNDRIAELEKENVELKVDLKYSIDMQKQMLDGFKTAIKEVEENIAREIPNLLKQFAERVKMEFYYEFDELIPSIMSDKIDKILKELIEE